VRAHLRRVPSRAAFVRAALAPLRASVSGRRRRAALRRRAVVRRGIGVSRSGRVRLPACSAAVAVPRHGRVRLPACSTAAASGLRTRPRIAGRALGGLLSPAHGVMTVRSPASCLPVGAGSSGRAGPGSGRLSARRAASLRLALRLRLGGGRALRCGGLRGRLCGRARGWRCGCARLRLGNGRDRRGCSSARALALARARPGTLDVLRRPNRDPRRTRHLLDRSESWCRRWSLAGSVPDLDPAPRCSLADHATVGCG
jgi:hypothetical protein